jgi:hypothetical protein
MSFELFRLKIQLDNLKMVLDDAINTNKSFGEQTRISKNIVELEHLIEKRTEYLKKVDDTKLSCLILRKVQ